MTIEEKFAFLVSLRVRDFNQFGAALIADCWCMTGGVIALADKLPEGRKSLINDLYETMTRRPENREAA